MVRKFHQLGVLATSVGVVLSAATGVAHAENSDTPAVGNLKNGIETLGYGSKVTGSGLLDNEFRYDGYIVVDKGVKIEKNGIKLSIWGNGKPDTLLLENPRGETGINQAYSIVATQTVGSKDVITFHLTASTLGGADQACPTPDAVRNFTFEVTLDTKQKFYESPKVDRISTTRCKSAGDPVNTMRPIVRMPFNNDWGGNGAPNYSQAGFGYIADDGQIPGKTFPISMWNPRQGLKDVAGQPLPGNYADHVLYQIVRSDGTPSRLTPQPKRWNVPSQWAASGARFLPPLDMKNDAPGYYKILVWPQAQNQDGTNSPTSWDATKVSDAWQLGSVYNQYKGPDLALAAPQGKAKSTFAHKVMLQGSADYQHGVRQVRVSEDGKKLTDYPVGTDGTWSAKDNDALDLAAGAHDLTLTGLDAAGGVITREGKLTVQVTPSPAGKSVDPAKLDQIALADVDGDGNGDILAKTGPHSGLLLFKGKGDKTFDQGTELFADWKYTHTVAGDFDGDGKTDIVAEDAPHHQLLLWRGKGRDTFAAPIKLTAWRGFDQVSTGDVDGDGKTDLIAENVSTKALTMWRGTGNTKGNPFSKPRILTPWKGYTQTIISDVDGDGHADLVAADARHKLMFWKSNGSSAGNPFGKPMTLTGWGGFKHTTSGDVNHDGKDDLLAVDGAKDQLKIWTSNGNTKANPFSKPTVVTLKVSAG